MEPADPAALVAAGYDRLAARYRELSAGSPVRQRMVRRLLDELTPGGTVADLGCGSGEPATRLLAAQHRVLGVDLSARSLELARAAVPGAGLVRADLTRLGLRPGSLDAVASFYALGHVPADRHAGFFADVATWLRPGGLLLTSAPLLPGDGVDPDWLGVRMFFGGIGAAATREAVAAAGLVLVAEEEVAEVEWDGAEVAFLWLLARRPAPG